MGDYTKHIIEISLFQNKNAFQYLPYRPPIDRILAYRQGRGGLPPWSGGGRRYASLVWGSVLSGGSGSLVLGVCLPSLRGSAFLVLGGLPPWSGGGWCVKTPPIPVYRMTHICAALLRNAIGNNLSLFSNRFKT